MSVGRAPLLNAPFDGVYELVGQGFSVALVFTAHAVSGGIRPPHFVLELHGHRLLYLFYAIRRARRAGIDQLDRGCRYLFRAVERVRRVGIEQHRHGRLDLFRAVRRVRRVGGR